VSEFLELFVAEEASDGLAGQVLAEVEVESLKVLDCPGKCKLRERLVSKL
jgi:hypothetical protein